MTDQYLKPTASYVRLKKEYDLYGKLVVAFDLDNTVHDYHGEGHTYDNVIALLRDLKSIGCYLICFTATDDTERVAGILKEKEIPFDAINENPPFFSCKSGKIYYNALLDDRAGLIGVYADLRLLVASVKSGSDLLAKIDMPFTLIDEPSIDSAGQTPVFVCTLPSGLDLYKRPNGVGGWQYLGESCGVFATIWDSAIGSQEELIAVAKDCYGLTTVIKL